MSGATNGALHWISMYVTLCTYTLLVKILNLWPFSPLLPQHHSHNNHKSGLSYSCLPPDCKASLPSSRGEQQLVPTASQPELKDSQLQGRKNSQCPDIGNTAQPETSLLCCKAVRGWLTDIWTSRIWRWDWAPLLGYSTLFVSSSPVCGTGGEGLGAH